MRAFSHAAPARTGGRQVLAGADAPAACSRPAARQPAAIRSALFTRRRFRLDRASWAALKQRAAAAGLTPSGALCAAYAEILCKIATSSRFTLNMLISQRPYVVRGDSEPVSGNFGSTIPLEVDFGRPEAFEKRARRLQNRLWDDLENAQFVPFTPPGPRLDAGSNTQAVLPVVFASSMEMDQRWVGQVRPGSGRSAADYAPQVSGLPGVQYAGTLVGTWEISSPMSSRTRSSTRRSHVIYSSSRTSPARRIPSAAETRCGGTGRPARRAARGYGSGLPGRLLTLDEHGLLHTAFFAQAAAPIRTAQPSSPSPRRSPQAYWRRSQGPASAASSPTPVSRSVIVSPSSWTSHGRGSRPCSAPCWRVPPMFRWIRLARCAHRRPDRAGGGDNRHHRASGRPVARLPAVPVIHAATADLVSAWTGGNPPTCWTPWAGQRPGHDGLLSSTRPGSTGGPKGVAMDHRGPVDTIADINRRLGVSSPTRSLACRRSASTYPCTTSSGCSRWAARWCSRPPGTCATPSAGWTWWPGTGYRYGTQVPALHEHVSSNISARCPAADSRAAAGHAQR